MVKNISKKIGLSVSEVRRKNPVEIASVLEKKHNKQLTFSSEFPFIGRGNVLRDGVVTSDQINQDIDRILKI